MLKKTNKLKELSSVFSENNITADTIEQDDSLIFEIKRLAGTVNDYRHESYVRHILADVIMIAFFAVLAGADEWRKIELFAKEKETWLRKYLELPFGIPTDDTIRLIISNIDPSHFYSMVITLLIHTIEQMLTEAGTDPEDFTPDVIAVDGKESRGSKRQKTDQEAVKALQTLNVFSTAYGMCLMQKFIEEKTNEIPAAQEILKRMDLKNCIVTADAMNCQKETARVIIDAKGDYVLALKGNQGLFYEEVTGFFDEELEKELEGKEGHYYKTVEKEHGGMVRREYYITEDTRWFSEKKLWKKLNAFGMVKKYEEKANGEIVRENRYYICSTEADARILELAARGHWKVESMHWQLDVTFRDDKNTSMSKTGAKNLQLMKKIVMSVLKIVKDSYGLSMSNIRYKLSLSFEAEIEKLVSLLSIESVRNALEK